LMPATGSSAPIILGPFTPPTTLPC
jgi:hypothetical protein